MMNCDDAQAIVSSWIKGDLDDSSLQKLKAHMESCQDCALRYRSLVLLMERDLGLQSKSREEDVGTFANSVMAALPDKAITRRRRARFLPFPIIGTTAGSSHRGGSGTDGTSASGLRHPAFAPLLGLAAAALFVVGLGMGIFFTKLNTNRVTIRFEITAPEADSVHLAGNFNNWGDRTYELRRVGSSDRWEITLRLAKDNFYVYNFVLDGEKWIVDPKSPLTVDDGFGGASSLLRL
jgi:anti-sigma factor RsiW